MKSEIMMNKNLLFHLYDVSIKIVLILLIFVASILVTSCGKALRQGAPIDLIWKTESPVITSSVEISGGTLWCGTFDKQLLKISMKDGKKITSFKATGEIYFKPLVQGKFIYFSTFDKKLFKCDTNLNIISQIMLPDRASSDFQHTDSLLVVPIRGKGIAVYSSDSLTFLYQITPLGADYVDSELLTENGTLYLGGIDNSIRAINLADGQTIWKQSLPGFAYSKAISRGDNIIASCDTSTQGGYIASYSYKSGALQKMIKSDIQVYFGFAQDSSRLYYSALNQDIVAINPTTFQKIWEYDQLGDESATKLLQYMGRIYFGTTNKIIVCLNSATGKVIFKKAINFSAGRAIVYNKNVYFLLSDGSMYKVVY